MVTITWLITFSMSRSFFLNLLHINPSVVLVQCVPIELLSTYFNLPQPSVVLVQCVSPWSYCQPSSTCLNPVWCWSSVCPHRAIVHLLQPASTQCWCWSSVCPHRAIVNLLQPASTQCGVGPVCVPIELLSTYFNLPQPSVVLVQCVSP